MRPGTRVLKNISKFLSVFTQDDGVLGNAPGSNNFVVNVNVGEEFVVVVRGLILYFLRPH